MEKGKTGKATWDAVAHRAFLDVCIEEVEANNRPTQCLNAVGYANLISKFNERMKRNYDRKQMKNRWETLKNDYNTWKTLTQRASSIGRDPNTHTIAASDEWWEKEIHRVPEASKFRNAPLQDEEKMSIIFDKHCVTNEHARVPVPSAHAGPSEDAHIVIDGDENDLGCEGDDPVTKKGEGKGKPKRACPYSPSPATKAAKVAKEDSPTDVQCLLSIMESRSRSKHSATSQVSINPARQELRDMVAQVVRDGGIAGSDEHFCTTQLFMQQEYRDAFSTFGYETPDKRLEWLRRTWAHHNKK
ncbi:zinc finger CCCH domain-containing protein 43-like [Brachypodium distachyon]|uniref:Myb/SANT-like domain-containing protein n=1 Tax=Brachypodium distachyon TaxID=15368 RepID=A0A0Q3RZJ7_BRADI|nr:zinc finger CCCH domain-containing protein 43-like [Brachypodium distachyon]KQK18034.1 hypothetical protein BRADI_1g38155v3 [Brachypodium distachyon]|eukprot:XP_024313534.1 zinc finger CCCH domain-containing protein 43-like [Brachypodium distachyon]